MKRIGIRILPLLLAVALLLTGCSGIDFNQLMGIMNAQLATPFSDMQYTRPDMDELEEMLQQCCQQAQSQTNANALAEKALEFYRLYNRFYTQLNLATIYYFKDMTDSYWEKEYTFCQGQSSTAEAALEELFCTLAASPYRQELEEHTAFGEGFFDSYMGGGLWDEQFSELMSREAELEQQYYDLCAQAQDLPLYSNEFFQQYSQPLGQLFVDLVKVRQEIAAYAGYEDYLSFAYDFYYYRDYSPAQIEAYLEEIQRELVPLYRQVEQDLDFGAEAGLSSEKETFAYVESFARDMGGEFQNAFLLLKQATLYDISYSPQKYNGSFELYLTDYSVPYVFMSPVGSDQDKLSFAHEFGHFCSDYVAGGSIAGIDVAEVFSQAAEYLSLCYGDEAGELEKLKLRDGLRIFVEQAAYSKFEQQVYGLTGEALTVEKVEALYKEIGLAFGFDSWEWDSRDYVLIGHFYSDPLYVISYVVSNDAALQVYQLEKETPGAGRELLQAQLATQEGQLLSFLKAAGLQNPLERGRMAAVRETFEKSLTENEDLLSSRSSLFIFVAPGKSARRQYLPG